MRFSTWQLSAGGRRDSDRDEGYVYLGFIECISQRLFRLARHAGYYGRCGYRDKRQLHLLHWSSAFPPPPLFFIITNTPEPDSHLPSTLPAVSYHHQAHHAAAHPLAWGHPYASRSPGGKGRGRRFRVTG